MENKNSILLYFFDISTLGLFQSRANLAKIQEETDGMWETKVQTPVRIRQKVLTTNMF